MKKIKTGLISLIIPIISIGQISNEKTEEAANKIQRNAKNEISFYKSIAKEKSYTNQTAFFEEIVLKSNNDEFRLLKKGKTKEGKFEEYHQFYHGIPVKNGVFVLHRTGGNIKSANGNYIRIGDLNPTPSISKNDVKAIWCNYLKIPESEVTRFKTKLLVVDALEQNENTNKTQPVLAYKIRLYSKHPSNILIGFVDARSGKVCLTEPLALTSSLSKINVNVGDVHNPMLYSVPIPPPATGTFATRYSGSQNATTESRDNLFFLEDWTRGDGIETLNLEDSNAADTTGAVSFSDANNNWTSDEYDNNDYDNAALDVHWALQEIYDFFEDNYSRSGWDSTGQKINAYVHAIIDGSRDNAAYYPDDTDEEYLAFGDGQSVVYPFVSLDAVAHEYAHGFTDHTSGFATTGIGRSFHEGISDIWACIVENDIAPQKDNWLIFEEIMRGSYTCDRNISDPDNSSVRTEIAHTFGTTTYNGNSDVYYRSGIMSHWFYRLSEGGSGTNGLGHSYNVYGLGLEVAADLVYHAQAGRFLNGTTDYALMRTNMINAADDLFGDNSFQSLQVETAWYAVGVGTNPSQVTLSGDGLICIDGSIITANNSPTGSTISWTTSSNLKVDSGQGTTTPTIKPKYTTSNGAGWVQANYTSGSYIADGPRKIVWVGKPQVYSLMSHLVDINTGMTKTDFCYGTANECEAVHPAGDAGITAWDWRVTGGTVYPYGSQYKYATIYPNSYSNFMVEIRAFNGCGEWTDWARMYTNVVDCYGYYMVLSPNPTSGETNLSIESTSEEKTFDENAEWELEVYSPSQTLKEKKTKLKGNSTKIQIQSWQEGVYVVRVKYKNEVLTGKLVVKK